jgi:hypothetical protein
MTRINLGLASVSVLMMLALAACGPTAGGDGTAAGLDGTGDADQADSGDDPAAGICPQDQPACIDTPQLYDDEPVTIDDTGIEQLRRDARFYLGKSQGELHELVRIGRIGDEHLALTEDYQVGRITVELDDVAGSGTPVVTSATVELPGGPETFDLDG